VVKKKKNRTDKRGERAPKGTRFKTKKQEIAWGLTISALQGNESLEKKKKKKGRKGDEGELTPWGAVVKRRTLGPSKKKGSAGQEPEKRERKGKKNEWKAATPREPGRGKERGTETKPGTGRGGKKRGGKTRSPGREQWVQNKSKHKKKKHAGLEQATGEGPLRERTKKR